MTLATAQKYFVCPSRYYLYFLNVHHHKNDQIENERQLNFLQKTKFKRRTSRKPIYAKFYQQFIHIQPYYMLSRRKANKKYWNRRGFCLCRKGNFDIDFIFIQFRLVFCWIAKKHTAQYHTTCTNKSYTYKDINDKEVPL